MKKVIVLLKLIEIARILGLDNRDLKNAEDFLMHNEFGWDQLRELLSKYIDFNEKA